MHVIVVGAGVVGVCTAYWLNKHGMRVTVLDRRSGTAQEASFGNAGIIGADHASPPSAPGVAGKWFSGLLRSGSPSIVRPTLDPALWRWTMSSLAQSRPERFMANKRVMHRLALYSRHQLHAVRDMHGFEYEARQGQLQLLRSARDVALAEPALRVLKENGVSYSVLSPEETVALEPSLYMALENGTPLAAAVHFPDDESGNCPLFARLLSQVCEREGVKFIFNSTGVPMQNALGAVSGVRLSDSRVLSADAVVIATGSEATPMLGRLGIRIPAFPVRGYSANLGIRNDAIGPRQAFFDEAYKTAITPFGRRLRISGILELGARASVMNEKALRTLSKVGSDWLPGAIDTSQTTWWSGIRSMTPDGPPLLGGTRLAGLFVNTGHGSHGWTMAAGSGKVVADLIAGATPDIDLQGLDIARHTRKN
jgi:D-amino-acid dehydrogenase